MNKSRQRLRRRIYKLVAEHAKKLGNLQDVYDVVVDSISDEISREEAKARVKASLGSFEEDDKIPDKVQFPFISILDKVCKNDDEDCRYRLKPACRKVKSKN